MCNLFRKSYIVDNLVRMLGLNIKIFNKKLLRIVTLNQKITRQQKWKDSVHFMHKIFYFLYSQKCMRARGGKRGNLVNVVIAALFPVYFICSFFSYCSPLD